MPYSSICYQISGLAQHLKIKQYNLQITENHRYIVSDAEKKCVDQIQPHFDKPTASLEWKGTSPT